MEQRDLILLVVMFTGMTVTFIIGDCTGRLSVRAEACKNGVLKWQYVTNSMGMLEQKGYIWVKP
jgi:hypothetical protein